MSQSQESKADAAQQRSEETRSFVRRVKGATRRRYTAEEKIRVVLEGFRREVTVNDLCRREGIKPHSYYALYLSLHYGTHLKRSLLEGGRWTMLLRISRFPIPIMLVALLAVTACGGSDESTGMDLLRSSDEFAGHPGAPGMPGAPGVPGAPAAPAAAATPAPREVVLENAMGAMAAPGAARAAPVPRLVRVSEQAAAADIEASSETHAQLVNQERIIVRTVEATIVVTEVQGSMDRITALARELGGWVVSTNRFEKHRGFISFRVPAEALDKATARLREMAVEVKAEVSDSRDVTDEYFDLRARLDNQKATEEALLKLLGRAETVEAALKVQQTLTGVQEEVERLQGKIKLLEETSAFSLVSVNLELEPVDMAVEEIADKTTGVGERVRFRAFFKPPEGIEDFSYTWDFGDGESIRGHQTAPTEEEDTRVTATVTHRYRDEEDSPYIVQFEIQGSGEAGAAEGDTTLMAKVTRIPDIVVFAGESIAVDEGEEVEFSGSFTRPPGLNEVEYRWDFGDGSEPATGMLGVGITTAVATHVYEHHRPFSYQATLTITAESEAGTVEDSSSLAVRVREVPGWVITGLSFGDQGKTAVRTLSAVGQGALIGVIWVAILSPAWLVVGGGGYWLIRRYKGRRRSTSAGSSDVRESQGDQ